jgi:hypothetical protein
MNDLTRRNLIIRTAATLGVLALADLGWGEDPLPAPADPGAGKAKSLILLYMAGGMSHLDTLDPKPGREVQGAIGAIPTVVDGIQLGEHLPALAKRMDRCALVRSMTSTQGAHEQGAYFLRTAYLQRGTARHPAFGAWAAKLLPRLNPTLPPYVTIGGDSRHPGAGFLEANCAPLPIGDPERGLAYATPPKGIDAERLARRQALLGDLDACGQAPASATPVVAYQQLYAEASKLMSSSDLAAFNIGQESEESRTAYGKDAFGHGCLLARRLVEHGVRTVEVGLGGWDTHDDNADRVKDRCAILDRALPALLDDLGQRGLLDTTMVAVVSEFGRTPTINQREGRDHHPSCFSVLLAGGGIRGGRVHGASDEDGHHPAHDPVLVPDLVATLAYGMGCDNTRVIHSPDGRPFTVADKGKALKDLFA